MIRVLRGLPWKRLGLLTAAVAIAFLIYGAIDLWPRKIDLAKEEVPFPDMELPLQGIGGHMYTDGGSIGLIVIDRKGETFYLAFNYSDSGPDHYPTAHHGQTHASMPGAVPFSDPDRAKAVTLRLLKNYGTLGDDGRIMPIYALQGHRASLPEWTSYRLLHWRD